MTTSKVINGVAWYRSDQWDSLRQVSTDRDKLEKTYFEWLIFALDYEKEMTNKGIAFQKIEIDVNELISWCKTNNKKVDGDSRAEFVTHKFSTLATL